MLCFDARNLFIKTKHECTYPSLIRALCVFQATITHDVMLAV